MGGRREREPGKRAEQDPDNSAQWLSSGLHISYPLTGLRSHSFADILFPVAFRLPALTFRTRTLRIANAAPCTHATNFNSVLPLAHPSLAALAPTHLDLSHGLQHFDAAVLASRQVHALKHLAILPPTNLADNCEVAHVPARQ